MSICCFMTCYLCLSLLRLGSLFLFYCVLCTEALREILLISCCCYVKITHWLFLYERVQAHLSADMRSFSVTPVVAGRCLLQSCCHDHHHNFNPKLQVQIISSLEGYKLGIWADGRDAVDATPASYSGGRGFRSRLTDRASWGLWFSSVSPSKCLDRTLNYARPLPSTVFQFSIY